MLNYQHLELCILHFRENHPNSGAHTLLALDLQISRQIVGSVLDDGQPQAGAAQFLGVTFVHPVKPLKYSSQLLLRDADAGIT